MVWFENENEKKIHSQRERVVVSTTENFLRPRWIYPYGAMKKLAIEKDCVYPCLCPELVMHGG